MLTLIKLLQSLVKTLHSEGTPAQVAGGVMLGALLGLSPLLSAHNLATVAAILLFDVSIGGAMIGLLVFTPVGFLLDPLFDRVGLWLLQAPALEGFWTGLYNLPVFPLSNFNNSVLLGSIVGWAVAAGPIYLAARAGVVKYRATLGARVQQSRWYRAIIASRAYNVYRMIRPD